MQKNIKLQFFIYLVLLLMGKELPAQNKKIWVSGMARSIFQQNKFESPNDTVTAVKTNSGYALADIALNAAPNANTYINAMVRVRNDFGGFWGSGVTFDLRQLYLKGVIKNTIKYQLGDINYKLTPFTFYSNAEELSTQQNKIMEIYRNMVHNDWFFNNNNTWRQQGAALDFTLLFPIKILKEMDVHLFSSRVNTSDNNAINDRFFYSSRIGLTHNNMLKTAINFIELSDVKGTSKSTTFFKNRVITGNVNLRNSFGKLHTTFNSEFGGSLLQITGGTKAGKISDYFYHAEIVFEASKKLPFLTIKYMQVGPDFRSVGSQSKRVNFDATNMFTSRYTNSQIIRQINTVDLSQDASIYRYNFNYDLDVFSPWLDNITPYGLSTPNRQGGEINLGYNANDGMLKTKFIFKSLQEVIGQGINVKRKFIESKMNIVFDIKKLMKKMKNKLQLTTNIGMQNTTRNTDLQQANIQLKTTIMDMGIEWEFIQDFTLLLAYRNYFSKGNEMLNLRNTITSVYDFKQTSANVTERIAMGAIQYHFSEKSNVSAIWQNADWKDKTGILKPYKMSQFSIVYILNF